MSSPSSANDVLFAGGGAPALQWADPASGQDYPVGTSYEGEITRTSAVQQRDIKDKSKIAVWPDGKPKWVALVTLRTNLRDPQMDEDDGQRTLWVSGKYLTNSVKDAVRQAGARQLEEGGYLKVTLVGYGTPQPGFRPPRYFDVKYQKPSPQKRAELAAQKAQQAAYQVAGGDGSDPGMSDPWAQPQNAFPQADPWGTQQQDVRPSTAQQGGGQDWGGSPMPGVGHPVPQQAPRPPQQPVQPPVGGLDTNVSPASVGAVAGVGQMDLSGMTPEARALIQKMYDDQQEGKTP